MFRLVCPMCQKVTEKDFVRPGSQISCDHCHSRFKAPAVTNDLKKAVKQQAAKVECPMCGDGVLIGAVKPGGKVKCKACNIDVLVPEAKKRKAKQKIFPFPCLACGIDVAPGDKQPGQRVKCQGCGAPNTIQRPGKPVAKTPKPPKPGVSFPCRHCGGTIHSTKAPGTALACKACGGDAKVPGSKPKSKGQQPAEPSPLDSGEGSSYQSNGASSGFGSAVFQAPFVGKAHRRRRRPGGNSQNNNSLIVGIVVFALGGLLMIILFVSRGKREYNTLEDIKRQNKARQQASLEEASTPDATSSEQP